MSAPCDNDELLFTCSCSELDHAARFWRMVDVEGYSDCYLDVIIHRLSWWRRLRLCWKLLWRETPCAYGSVADMVLKEEDLPRIRAWAERAEQAMSDDGKRRAALIAKRRAGGGTEGRGPGQA